LQGDLKKGIKKSELLLSMRRAKVAKANTGAEGVSVVLRHKVPIPLERPEIKKEILQKIVKE
jgi:hypothetical protein